MNISNSFKSAIANTFYDKEITKYSTIIVKESDGWTKKAGTTITDGTFMGNVRFDMKDKIQEDYAIRDEIDVAITTSENVPLETIIGYVGFQYKIFRVIPSDSHYLLLARKWSSRSSISISV